jgi:PKD repeat protein
MEEHDMRARVPLLALLCLLLASAVFAAGQPSSFALGQPEFLSTLTDTGIAYRATVSEAQSAVISVRLSTEDGLLDQEVYRAQVQLQSGPNEGRFAIAPGQLLIVNVYEDVTLTASLRLPDGEVLEDEIETTVVPQEASPESGSWGLVLASKPALVYTNRDTILHYTITNPKAKTVKVGLYLKFMNDKKKKKVHLNVTAHPAGGVNDITVDVPSSITTQARSKGDTILKTVMKVEGLVKKKDQAMLDYDFTVSASADPASGNAPLEVHFTGNATGGKFPYAYSWDFNDGGTSSESNPTHTYSQAGTYLASLAVSDSLGATVGATAHVTANTPPLQIVSCSASPTSGSIPLAVNFSVTATGGTGAYGYAWNFGDGGSSTLQNPSHTYSTPGQYAGVITVTSGTQTQSCTTSTISVTCPDLVVACTGPTSGKMGVAVTFSCSASGGSGTYTYDWDFGDGTTHSTSQNPSHVYQSAGTWNPKVTVKSCDTSKLCTPPAIVVTP